MPNACIAQKEKRRKRRLKRKRKTAMNKRQWYRCLGRTRQIVGEAKPPSFNRRARTFYENMIERLVTAEFNPLQTRP